jgi:hypothetical protein
MIPAWVFPIVEAASVADFLSRYYKADRYTGRGAEYVQTLRNSCERDVREKGYCCISQHDSNTGNIVFYTGEKNENK